ncbi:MAG TPA: HAD-IB family phosphatase [Anaerolineae bacterium]|nr:HAD-IB family phosphatase [Anaerolineae bacterium]
MLNNHPPVWPVTDLVIFDCDSTLSRVEGIDELARLTGSQTDIAALTDRAMNGEVPLESVYARRLIASNPTQAQVGHLRRIYRENVIPDAREVIAALQDLGCQVFIVSGGLIDPVRDFGAWLNVSRDHIYAVDMEYDQLAGQWWRYWEQPGGQNPQANYLAVKSSPLTGTGGKGVVVDRIRARYPGRVMLVGDGISDLEAQSHVELFVGFGGVTYRDRVAAHAPIYIQSPCLSPLLPIALGRVGNRPPWHYLFADGLQRVESGDVIFQDESAREIFLAALRR